MTVWVLFVWITATLPASYAFETKAECDRAADDYKRAVCVRVVVPKK